MTETLPNKRQVKPGFLPLSPPHSKPLIMIIGLDEDTRLMLRMMLEIWEYDVIEAETTDESIEYGNAWRPALILIDTTIHFTDTLKDVGKIRQCNSFKDTPSVLLSGYSQQNYRDAAISNGASGFIVKPVDFDVLHDHIKTLVGQDFAI